MLPLTNYGTLTKPRERNLLIAFFFPFLLRLNSFIFVLSCVLSYLSLVREPVYACLTIAIF